MTGRNSHIRTIQVWRQGHDVCGFLRHFGPGVVAPESPGFAFGIIEGLQIPSLGWLLESHL